MRLIPHPDHPPSVGTLVIASAVRSVDLLSLAFAIVGGRRPLRVADGAGRTDELWRATCVEAFVRGEDGRYREFNFAPTGAWAAYSFDGYREGMRQAAASPLVNWSGDSGTVSVRIDVPGDWEVALTAIIEEADGTKSYWALAHPDGPPDFHDPACFVLELPAPR
jgi:hypothetical protein